MMTKKILIYIFILSLFSCEKNGYLEYPIEPPGTETETPENKPEVPEIKPEQVPDEESPEEEPGTGEEDFYYIDSEFEKLIIENFPKYDLNFDGKIQINEAENIDSLYFLINDAKKISHVQSLEGIEKFKSLRFLSFYPYMGSDVDLSQNAALEELYLVSLSKDENVDKLKNLNISQNYNLKSLTLTSFVLNQVDISHLNKLEYLHLGVYKQTSLDISNLKNLKKIDVRDSKIQNIDFFNNNLLEEAIIMDNDNISEIDLSNKKNLLFIDCGGKNLRNISVKNSSNLKGVYVFSAPAFEKLCISEDQITLRSNVKKDKIQVCE